MVKLPGSLSLGGDGYQIGCINWYEMYARSRKYTCRVYVVQWLVKCCPTRRSVSIIELMT